MTDWTTCRVVRDRDGDLWGRNTAWTEPSWRRWVKLGGYWEEDGCFQIHMECRHGPLTPVLDADGLPVVTTVGDLLDAATERDALAATVERVRALATEWATQPTDYDEDTEQQIEDGNAIVRALEATPETGGES